MRKYRCCIFNFDIERFYRLRQSVLLILFFVFLFVFPKSIYASSIEFSGGYTNVDLQEGQKAVILSGGSSVTTDDVSLVSDSVKLYGEDYRYVDCSGNVKVTDKESNISVSTPALFYDRVSGVITADGWVEIDDPDDEAALSGAYLEYNLNTGMMKIQMKATITKETDSGQMKCQSDSISYDSKAQLVTLKGNAKVTWGSDTYNAAIIDVNLDTEEIRLHGTISGVVNG